MRWKHVAGILAVLAAFAAALGFFYPFRHRHETLQLHGVVETQEIRLGSKVGGRVEYVSAAEGDRVAEGQELVRFETPELQAQKEQLEARVKSLEAELLKWKNGPRKEEIQQARSEWESAEAELKFARDDFERVEKLFRMGGSTKAEYDQARSARDRIQGRSRSTQARLDLLLAGSRPEEIAEAEGRLLEARGKLHEVEANLREAVVRAPGPAILEILAVRKGDLVPPNQPIVRILRAEDMWVKVYVPETELGKVKLGQNADVYLDSFPKRSFAGTVFQIASESEFTPRNVQSVDERRHQVFAVKLRVPQPADPRNQVFKSGLAAEVFLNLHEP